MKLQHLPLGIFLAIAAAMGWEKFPAHISLAVTAALLAGGVVYSIWRTRGVSPRPA